MSNINSKLKAVQDVKDFLSEKLIDDHGGQFPKWLIGGIGIIKDNNKYAIKIGIQTGSFAEIQKKMPNRIDGISIVLIETDVAKQYDA